MRIQRHWRSKRDYRESLFYHVWRSILIVQGPCIYLALAMLPWLPLPALLERIEPMKTGTSAFAAPLSLQAAPGTIGESEEANDTSQVKSGSTLQLSGFSRLQSPKPKFPSLWSRRKEEQIGSLSLLLSARKIKWKPYRASGTAKTSVYQSVFLTKGGPGEGRLQLRWTEQRPLLFRMPDGSRSQTLPSSYRRLADGFALQFAQPPEFEQPMELIFRSGPTAASGAQDDLTVELSWPADRPLPAQIELPWNTDDEAELLTEGAQLQVRPAEAQEAVVYFSAARPLRLNAQQYLEIPVSYYAALDFAPGGAESSGAQTEQAKQTKQNGVRTLALLWQQERRLAPAEQQRALYQKLYSAYRTHLFERLQQQFVNPSGNAAAYSGTSGLENDGNWADRAALYLELLLQQNAADGGRAEADHSYEASRERLEQWALAEGLGSQDLAPYLGIRRETLERYILSDYARIKQVDNNYSLADWDLVGQVDLAELLFRYGDLPLLLGVLQRALSMRQQAALPQNLSDEQNFYVQNFLWRTTRIYPNNGLLAEPQARQYLTELLSHLCAAWLSDDAGLAPVPMTLLLDALQTLWELIQEEPTAEVSELHQWAYGLANQLLALLDAEGNLPELYAPISNTVNEAAGQPIPYFTVFHSLRPTGPEQSQNTTVVPGLWLWTAGSADVSYEIGQSVRVSADNFSAAQGNKLLILRGIYFYPEQVSVNGRPAVLVAQMPRPRLRPEAFWHYDPGNRLLAIEIPASELPRTELEIR